MERNGEEMSMKVEKPEESKLQVDNTLLTPTLVRRPSRIKSLDSSAYREWKGARKNGDGDSARSLSAVSMNRLTFENIDLVNTPLSSLRSCSEYYKTPFNLQTSKSDEPPPAKSLWSSLFSWTKKSKNKNKVRFKDQDEKDFLVDTFRFNQSMLTQDEAQEYRNSPANSYSRSVERSSVDSCSGRLTQLLGKDINTRKRPSRDSGSMVSKSKEYSIFYESSVAWDYLFGYNKSGGKHRYKTKEIELRNLKEPVYFSVYNENPLTNSLLVGRADRNRENHEDMGIRRVTSLRSLERFRTDSVDSGTRHTITSTHLSTVAPAFDRWSLSSWTLAGKTRFHMLTEYIRWNYYGVNINGFFYEALRTQPFTSGSYLRMMLLAGFCNTVFNLYNLVTWADSTGLSLQFVILEYLLYFTLVVQLIINLIQLPLRLNIHLQCWESSRVIEVDLAVDLIRTMLLSDVWLWNIILGNTLDVMALVQCLVSEVYLWLTPSDAPLRDLIISLCSTHIMNVVLRITVATVFSLSMHDPRVLSEARRRGLSKWDLDVLPTFVFSSLEEVNNNSCSICLGNFSMGEMLISLPCDKKHSFHASCIRQWLERQNSCPLCQRMV